MKCKICGESCELLFTTNNILGKYKANYLRCTNCGFIFIENPFWLEEAYTEPISELDNGILRRNDKFANYLARLLKNNAEFSSNDNYLDYGSGYGIFVRMMRDRGYNFFAYDQYCKNIFSQEYSIQPQTEMKFKLITLLEVIEHISDPFFFLQNLSEKASYIFITTELIPNIKINSVDDWHYFSPLPGQHISFFTNNSLKILSVKLGMYLESDKKQIHLLHKTKFSRHNYLDNRIKKYFYKKLDNYVKGVIK